MDQIPSHFKLRVQPVADPKAIVRVPKARFTILTSRLIRMEYDPTDVFEDGPSQVFWYRQQDVPPFQLTQTEGELEISTGELSLIYKTGEKFMPETLYIHIRKTGTTWFYGDANLRNLGGTYRTLDEADGAVPLESGLVSRSGWVVVDDSRGLVFNEEGWLEERKASEEALDLYFFGYGDNYQACLTDYCKVSGPVPLIPRWVLGNWWSRYWAYTQPELAELMLEFKSRQVPLSVCIVDMDWHITKTGNQSSGWTGYTWNRELFPDPQGFILFLHELGLRTALNLHPALGVWPHEEMYPQMARAMGIDPASGKPVEFVPTDPKFSKAYLEYLHHPQEAMGIDFWWMDWQQGNPSRLAGLNLLWWINHMHFLDLGRDGVKRPFIFSRWGGLGNQRYPIGFSGDTVVSWDSLAFQPYFTATAANVGYGWWSHDIGGHMQGIEDAELYTRWVQFGILSPITRLHCTANPYHERRPWGYDAETFRITSQAFKLRHALIPYLYSMAWRNFKEGVSLIRPMYYLHPEKEEAYACPNQYAFGSELIAAPYVTPKDPDTRLSRQVVWLPEGDWYDFFSGRYFPGNGWYALYGGLDEIPVFARAGAIVPVGPLVGWGGVDNPTELTLNIFPGADNLFELFEDDGVGQGYLCGNYAITPLEQKWGENQAKFQVGPAGGDINIIPGERNYTLVFRSISEPKKIKISLNGNTLEIDWRYDSEKNNLTISDLRLSPTDVLLVEVEAGSKPLACRDEAIAGALAKMVKSFRMGSGTKVAVSARLAEISKDPGLVADYQPAMSKSQLRALFEVVAGAGVDRHTLTGEEMIILWNNHGYEGIAFRQVVEQFRGHSPKNVYRTESRTVPRFKFIQPRKDFGKIPTLLQVDYEGFMKIVYTYNMDGKYPRPETGMF